MLMMVVMMTFGALLFFVSCWLQLLLSTSTYVLVQPLINYSRNTIPNKTFSLLVFLLFKSNQFLLPL